MARIGTVIHGALGDCYEQLCAIRILRAHVTTGDRWIGFFDDPNRLQAMLHFELDMLDEVHADESMAEVPVDRFYQFQVRDPELRENLLDRLPEHIKTKFDTTQNLKPWHVIREHDYGSSGLGLALSAAGRRFLPTCMTLNQVDPQLFGRTFTVGYLWRYRQGGGAISSKFQRPAEWILRTKSELFRRLIDTYGAHVFICGMNQSRAIAAQSEVPMDVLREGAFVEGEMRSKYAEHRLDLPASSTTYLRGLGYAAEMAIMARCDLLLMMPSGFSEPLWMLRRPPVVLLDPPPHYLAKLHWNRMPLFDNNRPDSALFHALVPHTAGNVLSFLRWRKLLPPRATA